MMLRCEQPDGTLVGTFRGTIAQNREPEIKTDRERFHTPPTHLLICSKLAPVATGLYVRDSDGLRFEVAIQQYGANSGNRFSTLWELNWERDAGGAH
jgi:hypothetical protein